MVSALLLGSSAHSASAAPKVCGGTYEYVTMLSSIDYFTDAKNGLKAAEKDFGVKTKFSGPTENDINGLLQSIDQAIARTPELDDKLLPLEVGLADLTELRATAEGAVRIKNGNAGMVIASDAEFGDEVWVSYQGKPLGVGIYKSGEVHPNRVFNL